MRPPLAFGPRPARFARPTPGLTAPRPRALLPAPRAPPRDPGRGLVPVPAAAQRGEMYRREAELTDAQLAFEEAERRVGGRAGRWGRCDR
jgi:hypothetical protein